jgi:uncharacterized phiE125 gp8 family phage protein
MPSILLSGPALEPISLDEAKAFLKVEMADDDDVIAALIAGARVHVEAQTRRALITQSWRLVRDAWPDDGRIEVLLTPLQAVTGVRIYRIDGTTQSLDASSFVVQQGAAPGVLSFNAPPPAPGRPICGIELDVTVGYGDAAADVPAALRQAIRMLVAHWYDNRGVIAVGGTLAVLPDAVAPLIASYRVLSL